MEDLPMKRDNILLTVCRLVSSAMVVVFIIACSPQKALTDAPPASSSTADDLRITLITDKTTYSVGDEIHLEVVLSNAGDAPFRILMDKIFIGSRIECADLQGKRCVYEGGYASWSPKVNIYTGRTYLLKPKEKMNIKMDALVYDNYKLIFSNLFDRKGSSGNQEFKKRINLPPDFPDKYLSPGRIISLLKPGTYKLTYVYETAESDKHWMRFAGARTPEEASVDLLFIGKAMSNTVELVIK
jgi:hypothetical protein